ncbi:hypothetical protein ACFOWA_13005 [Pedobacter lithocola]|uniref:Uncharacterized protein n=1 Tax=Pedobacter lithocola TaxID=1908239 RepID=A0ABV8PCX4_9SPHI
MNFVPKDPGKEFGQDGIWTGKLFEWNLTGDTIFVQELDKSAIISKQVFKVGVVTKVDNNINSVVKNNKLESLNGLKDKEVNGFFGWLVDKLGELIGQIGSWFGLLTHNDWAYDTYNDSFDSEWRLDIDLSSIFSSGGGSGGDVGYYISAGGPVYADYTPGYNQQPIDTFSDYGNYPGGPSVDVHRFLVDYLVSAYDLNDGEKYFLLQNVAVAEELRKYDAENLYNQVMIKSIL